MARLQEFYNETVRSQLMEKFGFKNVMQVPRIEKITLNTGVGEAVRDKKLIEKVVSVMEQIAGQKVVVTKAKKSIAGFSIRDDYPIGVKVTLRKKHMYEFLDRLINIAIPRIRDFRGVSARAFDGGDLPQASFRFLNISVCHLDWNGVSTGPIGRHNALDPFRS